MSVSPAGFAPRDIELRLRLAWLRQVRRAMIWRNGMSSAVFTGDFH